MTKELWDAALDRVEADLRAVEDALRHGRPVDDRAATELPTQPMPVALGFRAQALLSRTQTLETRATGERDRIRECLRAMAGHRAPAPAATGRIVDVGA